MEAKITREMEMERAKKILWKRIAEKYINAGDIYQLRENDEAKDKKPS